MTPRKSSQIRVTGIDHICITVSDLRRAEKFYDRVMRFLGFGKGTGPIAGEPHRHYYNRDARLTIRPAANLAVARAAGACYESAPAAATPIAKIG